MTEAGVLNPRLRSKVLSNMKKAVLQCEKQTSSSTNILEAQDTRPKELLDL